MVVDMSVDGRKVEGSWFDVNVRRPPSNSPARLRLPPTISLLFSHFLWGPMHTCKNTSASRTTARQLLAFLPHALSRRGPMHARHHLSLPEDPKQLHGPRSERVQPETVFGPAAALHCARAGGAGLSTVLHVGPQLHPRVPTCEGPREFRQSSRACWRYRGGQNNRIDQIAAVARTPPHVVNM